MPGYSLALAAVLAAIQPDSSASTAAAAPVEMQPDRVLRSETVEARFVRWDVGDYVWAVLEVPGREPIGAWVEPPIDHFLTAFAGEALTLRIDTVETFIPEAGEAIEVPHVAEASVDGTPAALWWERLDDEQRRIAEHATEEARYPPPD